MSDAKLRELERRWRETGAVEDDAAYLLERVRAGTLTTERLELAAYCGHLGARAACEGTVGDEAEPSTRTWREGLKAWGDDVFVRFGVLAARGVVSMWEQEESNGPSPRAALNAVEEWLACPCRGHEEAAAAAQKPFVRPGRTFADAVDLAAVHGFEPAARRELARWALT